MTPHQNNTISNWGEKGEREEVLTTPVVVLHLQGDARGEKEREREREKRVDGGMGFNAAAMSVCRWKEACCSLS